MQLVSVYTMKAVGVILFALLSRVVAYTPCLLQSEFDTVMCNSYVCMECVGMDFCEEKCMAFQQKYPKCRCPSWPCSRRCYHDDACPNDEDLPTCVDPTTTPPPTPAPPPAAPAPADEVVEEEAVEEEAVEEEEIQEEEQNKEIQEMPDDMPGGDGDGELEGDGDDYDYGDSDEGEWVDPFAGENDWETNEKQGDDSDGQLGFLRRKQFLKTHPGWKAHHHGKKSGHGRKHKKNFLMRFLRRHHLGKKLGLIFARGGQKNHHAPASKAHQES